METRPRGNLYSTRNPHSLVNLLDGIALRAITLLAKQLDIARRVAATPRGWDYVIVLKILPSPAFGALAAVSAPNFPSDFRGYSQSPLGACVSLVW
jgi:hypothetical protein